MAGSRRVTIEFLGDDKSASRTARNVDTTTSKLGDTFKKVGKAAAIGLGAGLLVAGKFLFDATKAAMEDQVAQEKLATTLRNTAGATDAQIASVEDWISAQGRALGVTDDELRPAMQRLVEATGNVGEAQKLASLAMDVSAGTGRSLESVSIALMKAENGQVSALSRLGIQTTKANGETISFDQAVKRMSDTFGGQAAAKADTLQGKMDRLRLIFDETREEIGAKLIPILTRLADWFFAEGMPAIQRMAADLRQKLGPAFSAMGEFIGKLVAKVRANWPEIRSTITNVLRDVAGAVRNIVGAIRAIWNKWGDDIRRVIKIVWPYVRDTIKNALKVIKGVIQVVTGIIKGDWKQVWQGIRNILGGVLGQIKNMLKTALKILREVWRSAWDGIKDIGKRILGAIVDVIAKALDKARDRAVDIFNSIKDRVTSILGSIRDRVRDIVSGVKDALVNAFGNARDRVADIVSGLKDRVVGIFGNIMEFIRGIPGKIRDIFSNVWSGIASGLKSAVNSALGLPLVFPGWDWPGPGGIVRRPTLAMVGEAGPEAVVPLSRAGGMGGITIVVNGALDPNAVSKQILELLQREQRLNGGVLPGLRTA